MTLLLLICFSSAFQLSKLSEVYYLNILRIYRYTHAYLIVLFDTACNSAIVDALFLKVDDLYPGTKNRNAVRGQFLVTRKQIQLSPVFYILYSHIVQLTLMVYLFNQISKWYSNQFFLGCANHSFWLTHKLVCLLLIVSYKVGPYWLYCKWRYGGPL